MSVATAEDFAGFNWVFGLLENVALTIMTATEPLFVALNETSTELGVLNVLGVLGVLDVLKGVGCGKRGVARRACAHFFAIKDLSVAQ